MPLYYLNFINKTFLNESLFFIKYRIKFARRIYKTKTDSNLNFCSK